MLIRTEVDPPLTRARAWAAIAAAALTYSGQLLLTPQVFFDSTPWTTLTDAQSFHLGWSFLLAGFCLFFLAWWRSGSRRPNATDGAVLPPRGNAPRSRPWRTWVLATAVALSGLNAIAYARYGESGATRGAWVLSIVLLVASTLRPGRIRPPENRATDLAWSTSMLLLLAVLALATYLRLVDLRDLPLAFHGDMAMMGLGAREWIEGEGLWFATGWANIPNLGFALEAFGLRWVSNDLFGLRMAAALAGIATVIGIYALAAMLFGRRIAILATAVATGDYVLLHFSRLPAYIDPVPFVVLGFFWFVRGLHVGSRTSFALAGVTLALGCLMYYSGRIAIFICLAFFIYLLLFRRRLLSEHLRGLLLFALAAVVTLAPMLVYFAQHTEAMIGRSSGVFVLNHEVLEHLMNKYHVESTAGVLAEQGWRSLLMFNYTTDTSGQFGFSQPFVTPWLAPLLVLGVAFACTRPRDPAHAFSLIWLVTTTLIGSMLTVDAPFWPRLVVIAPIVAVGVAVGLHQLAIAIGRAAQIPPRARHLPFAASLAGILLTTWINWDVFATRARMHVEPAEWLGRQIADTSPDTKYCMVQSPRYFGEEHIRFLTRGYDLLDFPREQLDTSLAQCLEEKRVWVIYRPDHDDVLERLQRKWPNGRAVAHDYPNGAPGPVFWQMSGAR